MYKIQSETAAMLEEINRHIELLSKRHGTMSELSAAFEIRRKIIEKWTNESRSRYDDDAGNSHS